MSQNWPMTSLAGLLGRCPENSQSQQNRLEEREEKRRRREGE